MGRVIVAGSINMDIITRVSNLPATGETIKGKYVEYLAGGKGLNQAIASAKMGAETILIGRLGNDIFADTLRDFIKQHNVNIDYIKNTPKESGTAFINVADNGQNTIVVVTGSNGDVGVDDIEAISINKDDIAISQFEIPIPTVLALFKKAKSVGARTILNPSPIQNISNELLSVVDILIVNETELGFIKGESINEDTSIEDITKVANQTKNNSTQTIIVTLGSKGALIVDTEAYLVDAHKVCAIDTVGAGDCFTGVAASELVKGKTLKESIQTANKAASICVTRKGAAPSMPHKNEL